MVIKTLYTLLITKKKRIIFIKCYTYIHKNIDLFIVLTQAWLNESIHKKIIV